MGRLRASTQAGDLVQQRRSEVQLPYRPYRSAAVSFVQALQILQLKTSSRMCRSRSSVESVVAADPSAQNDRCEANGRQL
jgi:hypothetical protein